MTGLSGGIFFETTGEKSMKIETQLINSENKYRAIVVVAKEARKLNERKRELVGEKITTTAMQKLVNGALEIKEPEPEKGDESAE